MKPARGRVEDARMLRGQGRFTDDWAFDGEAWMVFLRSPFAHALIGKVDVGAARRLPGVFGVFTADDMDIGPIRTILANHPGPNGAPMYVPPRGPLAVDRVRYLGEPVIAIVARTEFLAREACELCNVEFSPLPVVTGIEALAADAPQLWSEVPGNLAFTVERGCREAVDAAFAKAARVVELDISIPRTTAFAMEPRAAIATWDGERYTLRIGTHTPHTARQRLASDALALPEDALRILVGDMGGSFGMREGVFPEYVAALWATRHLAVPVRWRAERSEAMLSDSHARDQQISAALALDGEGGFLGIRVATHTNLGAWLTQGGSHVPVGNVVGLAGPYSTPAIHVRAFGYYSNTVPTAPYRGAGRPEASYVLERLVDAAAVQTGIDRIELRRRNLVPCSAMPHSTPFGLTIDSGDFPRLLAVLVESADWSGFPARRAESEARGLVRGLGVALSVELAGGPATGPLPETACVSLLPDGRISAALGTQSHGQGHETAFTTLLAEIFGLERQRIVIVTGDTDAVPSGAGSFGSRSLAAGGTALRRAAQNFLDLAIAAASAELGGDVELSDGLFRGPGNRSLSLSELAARGLPLTATATASVAAPTYPNAAAATEVEIDPETGAMIVLRHLVVHDSGVVMFPALVEGQIHGGSAQGLSQGLGERIVYDDNGQLLTGSLMDFMLPRASDLPSFETVECATPTGANILGVKGVGETGTVVAMPSLASAVADALRSAGARLIEMPFTPERLWATLHGTEHD